MIDLRNFRLAGLTLGLALAGAQQALALSKEAAIENCRNSVGRPIVQACMHGGGGNIEACRAQATPKVRACVMAALNAANGRANVAVAVPTEQAPSADVVKQAAALPIAFVAPPRTIADITAILDSEKPDPHRLRNSLMRRMPRLPARPRVRNWRVSITNAATPAANSAD